MSLINKQVQLEDLNVKIKDLKYSYYSKDENDLSDNLYFYPNIRERFEDSLFVEMNEKQVKSEEKSNYSYLASLVFFVISLDFVSTNRKSSEEIFNFIILIFLIFLIIFLVVRFRNKNINSKIYLTEKDLNNFELIKELLEYNHHRERKQSENNDIYSTVTFVPLISKLRVTKQLDANRSGYNRITYNRFKRRRFRRWNNPVENFEKVNYLFLLINLKNNIKYFKFKLSHSLIFHQRTEDKLFEEEIEIIYNELRKGILNEI